MSVLLLQCSYLFFPRVHDAVISDFITRDEWREFVIYSICIYTGIYIEADDYCDSTICNIRESSDGLFSLSLSLFF